MREKINASVVLVGKSECLEDRGADKTIISKRILKKKKG
jgi:hypothetical protein